MIISNNSQPDLERGQLHGLQNHSQELRTIVCLFAGLISCSIGVCSSTVKGLSKVTLNVPFKRVSFRALLIYNY